MTVPSADASPAPVSTNPADIDPSTVVIDQAAPAIDANTADSSAVDVPDAKEPASLLDVIKSVVEKPAEPEAPSAPEGEKVDPAAVEEATVADTKAEDDANLPFHNHPRWKSVLAERDSYREAADHFGQITEFMAANSLTGDEMSEGFEVMAALKSSDHAKLGVARDYFVRTLAALDETLGNVLPADLQSRVDEGLIDEDGAAELARSRAAEALRSNQDATRETRTAEAIAATEAAKVSGAMIAAVEGWEERAKASDPDYAKKADDVREKCQVIVLRTGKPPMTPAEATALADQALAEVNARYKSMLPKPRPIVPTPTGSSATTVKAPTTLREAIEAGAARSN